MLGVNSHCSGGHGHHFYHGVVTADHLSTCLQTPFQMPAVSTLPFECFLQTFCLDIETHALSYSNLEVSLSTS